MKRLLLLLLSVGLYIVSVAQDVSTTTPVMTGSITGRKVLAERTYTFNVGSAIPYFYNGSSDTLLQVGFPYNVLYMDQTFAGDIFVSKGYYPDYIQLKWEVVNNASKIDHFEVFRKKLNEPNLVWVENLDANARKWEDYFCEANEVYQYTLHAIGVSVEEQEFFTFISGVGFRAPLATVTGRVSFSGGNGVQNVVITADTENEVPARSINLSGSSYIEVPQYVAEDFSAGFTFQAWLKFSSTNDAGIFQKDLNFDLSYINNEFVFTVGTEKVALLYDVPTDKFIHVTAVYDGDSAKIYVPIKTLNGQGFWVDSLLVSKAEITNSISENDSTIFLGKAGTTCFNGNIDEVRIWKRALEKDEILRDFNRYLTGKEDGFFAYLRMNEGFGERVYDISKSGSYFNANHGDFVGANIVWSDTVPTIEQLGNRGITDKEGNYIIAGIPFLTDGSPYKFTPMLAPHQFEPAFKILYLSEDAVVHNNINFTDISSFYVNGRVLYRNTSLGVKGVKVLIDGEPVFGPDYKPEETNEQGEFEMQVPIGYHYISLQKDGHVFDMEGRFPYDCPDSITRYNFNQNLTIGAFSDTTLITVVGRVIGGTGSNEIAFGFGQSVNNIGKATITLDHSEGEAIYDNINDGLGTVTFSYRVATEIDENGDTTFTDIQHDMVREERFTEVHTSTESGEFVAKLIPEKFVMVAIKVNANSGGEIESFFDNRVIDLSTNPTLKYEYLYDEENQLLDSMAYHVKLNYIYQTQPEISVTNINNSEEFYGEAEIVYTNPVNGEEETIVVFDHFMYPVFEMFKDYSPKISVFESYENYDDGATTNQSIKEAEIKIVNDLALQNNTKIYQLTPEMDGVVVDTFKVGLPNIAKNEVFQTSFTKTMEVYVTIDGNTYSWEPGGNLYRAYILGQNPKGNNFYTEGPQVPEIILHDPPGSKSSAYIKQGSSYSVSTGYSTKLDNGSGIGLEVLLGCTVQAGGGLAGPVIKTETKNSAKTGISFSTTVNESGKYVQTYSFSERIATSSDPGMVGSIADIYIGKSYNYYYGETDNLKIVPYDLATTNGITALGESELEDTQYTLGIVEGFIMNPDNSDTYFIYSQGHILNKLLPELESRRNNLFMTSPQKYRSEISHDDLRYGIAHSFEIVTIDNDTVINGYFVMETEAGVDSILTYSFYPEQEIIEDINGAVNDTIYENDSIRYYNEQIGIWIDAIRLNESEKAMAIENDVLEQNISFDGGVGSISRTETQTLSYHKQESRTKNMHFNAQGSVGFLFNRTGVVATGQLNVSHSLGVSSGESFSQTMEYGYTLTDGNVGDYYSINVYRRPDNGIFNADDLEETKLKLPLNFEFGILGQGVSIIAGGLTAYLSGSYASGGIPIIAGSAGMVIAAGCSYIPYDSFKDEVQDYGDLFSLGQIRVSSFDISSPIFSTLGGQTMCPFQDLEHTFFYRNAEGDSIVLHKATLQREKPEINVDPTEVHNVPITDRAYYNLLLTNNSESGDDQWYKIRVVEQYNPNGANVKIDGLSANNRTFLIPANTTLNKSMSVGASDKSFKDYDNIAIALLSTCQSDPTDFMADIGDTVFISAHFQAACTNVEILEPLDNWVVNADDNDIMTVRIGGYNLAYSSFESFRFEYKASSGSIWVPVKYFVNDPDLTNKDEIPDTLLIDDSPFVTFNWDMTNLKDREYDLRVVSYCSDRSENESTILSGILDGQRPQVFGTPQPADGILNIGENISVQFNEPIEGGLLTQFNFDIKGTLNYYLLKHEACLHLNGSTDYASIPEGLSFNDKSFTIEFWVLPDVYGNSVILSQGNDPASSLEIGLEIMEGDYSTYFKIGNVEYCVPFQFSPTVPAEAWQHMAYVYDYETGDIFIYQNDNIILEVRSAPVDFKTTGRTYLGKSSLTGEDYFAGNIHELRIWSKYLSLGDVYANQYTILSGNEVGLYGYWTMDEAFGELAVDKASNRHMNVFAPWKAYPGGLSWDFSGNNFLEIFTGYFAIIPEMDYTVEFWFKDDNPSGTVCLFSNQKGDGTEGDNLMDKALSIYATLDGKIWVSSQGNLFEAVTNDYFDNSWHHFALVVRRRGNVTALIDGEPQNERENTILGGIAGANMYLGARVWNNLDAGEDWYYSGKLDEFRLWNLAKTTKQIRLDMNSKLSGDEIGLMVYLPFEGYYEDGQGVVQHKPTLENFVSDNNATDASVQNEDAHSTDAPNMKDVRPVQNIGYDFISSEDKIIINPESYLFPQLEKNIIEITVEKVEDKYGNRMASPVTWTAYVHRNQLRWEDERRNLTKEIYEPMDFVSTIKNTGGQQIGFSIINLPAWLTCSPSVGVINPESTLELTFTIYPALNIGEYNADIVLRTENGFDEKLPITVSVYKKPPDWSVDPIGFDYSMNIVGKVKIDGLFSSDRFDMVVAFGRGTDIIRGVTNVRYVEEFDSYLIFMTVYGNPRAPNEGADYLDFRIWDASVGQILDNVLPVDMQIIDNDVLGTTWNPIIFESTGYTRHHVALNEGWTWVSFNKLSPLRYNVNDFLWSLEPINDNDLIQVHGGSFIKFSENKERWLGGIDSIDFKVMYQVKFHKPDTIIYSGISLVPEDNPIELFTGWNAIGYLPDLTMDVNDAMRNYTPAESDIIKSQSAFSMYDSRIPGWIGTLEIMQPGKGYMMNVNGEEPPSLVYPSSTVLKNTRVLNYSSAPSGWDNDLLQYAGNLSVVARVDFSELPEINVNSDMVLGAFINSECHGFVKPITQSGIGYNPFFLSVSNNQNGQQIKFRLYDGFTGNTYSINEVKPFVQNAVYGTTQEPVILTINGLLTGNGEFDRNTFIRCYPNPFNDEVNVEFSGNLNVSSIDVMSTTGSLVKRIFNGNAVDGINTVKWNGTNGHGYRISAGIYYIRVVTDSVVETVKISKTK